MDAGDSAWMLTSTALVLFMVPGLALFYGGLVGQKNVIAMMAESFVAIGVVTVVWAVIGYSLAFGQDHSRLIGAFNHVMLRGLGAAPSSWASTRAPPHKGRPAPSWSGSGSSARRA